MPKVSAAHQAVIDVKNAAEREKLAYHFILSAMVSGSDKWGSLQRVGSAYDRGDSWVWQITFTPRMQDAVIMETFSSHINQRGHSVRCFYLEDSRKAFEDRYFEASDPMSKLQQLYWRAKEMWNKEVNTAA